MFVFYTARAGRSCVFDFEMALRQHSKETHSNRFRVFFQEGVATAFLKKKALEPSGFKLPLLGKRGLKTLPNLRLGLAGSGLIFPDADEGNHEKNTKPHFVKRGFFVVCPYGLLCHPCGRQGRRKKRKNHTF